MTNSVTRAAAGSAPESRPLRADAARNRQALMDAAQHLFTTRGLSVTLDEIAAEAGVNVATAYRHFANKHELAQAFLEAITAEAIAIAEDAAAVDDPWQGLTQFFTSTAGLIAANRALHDVVTANYTPEWMQQLEDRVNPLLRRLLTRAQRAGQVRPGLEPADLGVLLQMLAVVTDIEAAGSDALLRRYLTVVLDGLRPDGPQPPGRRLPGRAPSSAAVHAAATAVRRPAT